MSTLHCIDRVRGRSTPQKLGLRARIVLLAAEGAANHAIAQTLGTNRKSVLLWRGRWAEGGLGSPAGSHPARTQASFDGRV